MSYHVEYTVRIIKELEKLDKYTKQMIKAWIDKNLVNCTNPRSHGKALTAKLKGRWRYRIGDYRLICFIDDNKLVIIALNVGHRNNIYK